VDSDTVVGKVLDDSVQIHMDRNAFLCPNGNLGLLTGGSEEAYCYNAQARPEWGDMFSQ
jgi:hypothetical protein